MTKINDGCPAFPDPGRAQSAKQREVLTNTGMTLRDYFAAKALQGIITNANVEGFGDSYPLNNARYAQVAYILADAMLAARGAQ